MAELVEMPGDFGGDLELVLEEIMALHHVGDHIFVVGDKFIVKTPASMHKLKLLICDELLELKLVLV